jgi:hypothetical protein
LLVLLLIFFWMVEVVAGLKFFDYWTKFSNRLYLKKWKSIIEIENFSNKQQSVIFNRCLFANKTKRKAQLSANSKGETLTWIVHFMMIIMRIEMIMSIVKFAFRIHIVIIIKRSIHFRFGSRTSWYWMIDIRTRFKPCINIMSFGV